MKVKIRQEKDEFLAYFIDSRRLVSVNETGARILQLLLNEGKSRREITKIFSYEYGIKTEKAAEDIAGFLKKIRNEIQPDGFNVIEQEQLRSPLGIELEITTSCNLSCRHCFQNDHGSSHMPTEKVLGIIGNIAKFQVCEVSLIGGEPFRHPGLFEILEYCQQCDMAINLVTNGTLITEVELERMSDIKRLVTIVSLDGDRLIHDYIRGKNVFIKVDALLKKMARKMPVEITCTLNSLNLPIYEKVIKYCEEMGVPCNFNLFKPFKPDHTSLIPDPHLFFDTVYSLLKLRRDKGYRIGLSNAALVTEILGLAPRNECRATRSGMVINIEGRMLTCPSLTAAGYYHDMSLPLFDEHFLNNWLNHEAFVKFRQNGLRECQARSFIYNHDVRGYDPYGITAFKKYWKQKNLAA